MRRPDYIKTVKMAVGSVAAAIIALIFRLDNSISTGITALLSIQDTKRETFLVAGKRFCGFFLAYLIAGVCFTVFGYHVLSFGLFLFVFILACSLLDLSEGIVTNAVLVTHYMEIGNMSPPVVLNEFKVFATGIGVAVLLNLYMPDLSKNFHKTIETIEAEMGHFLCEMGNGIVEESIFDEKHRKKCSNILDRLKQLIKRAEAEGHAIVNNRIRQEEYDYSGVAAAKKEQRKILEKIQYDADKLTMISKPAEDIGYFLQTVGAGREDAAYCRGELKRIYEKLCDMPAPPDRVEFENRAVLLHILFGLDHFFEHA